MDAETAVQQARTIIRQIGQYNRQHATAILMLALRTVLPGSVILFVLAVLGNYVIGTINATFGNRLFTSAAVAVTFLVSVLAARAVWLWADHRFQGWTLIRTVGQVNSDIRQLERAIEAGEIHDPERILSTAQSAWEMYVAAMQAAGFAVE